MTSKEARMYQLKQLKGKPLKQKIGHIMTYYWLPIVLVLFLVIFIGTYIFHLVTAKDLVLNVTCINAISDSEHTEALISEFAEKANIDLNEYDVHLSTNLVLDGSNLSNDYNTSQIIAAQVNAQFIDVLASDMNIATSYFYQDAYYDLNQLLTPQQKNQYAKNFLYADMAVVRRIFENGVEVTRYPDPTKPENMEEPVPVALLLRENCDFALKYYPNNQGCVAIGIMANSENLENALAFLNYVMQQ